MKVLALILLSVVLMVNLTASRRVPPYYRNQNETVLDRCPRASLFSSCDVSCVLGTQCDDILICCPTACGGTVCTRGLLRAGNFGPFREPEEY